MTGPEDAAVRHWTGFAYSIADRYFIPGGDKDDARQEALVGLLAALRTWDRGKGTLRSFVALCVERRVQEAVRHSNRLKHTPLTGALRVMRSEDGGERDAFESGHSALGRDPHLVAVENEELRELVRAFWVQLSPLERRAVLGRLDGLEYADIGAFKQIDNALHRARKKLAA